MKTRLDQLLVDKGLAENLEKSRALIGAGKVLVNEHCVDKQGAMVDPSRPVRVKASLPFVSRGGLKLEKALREFTLPVEGSICIDIGASSGGFTDCLLQHGAKKVFAVDVAYGQLDWKLRQDPRVVVMERCNARYLTTESIPDTIDICVIDSSFISLKVLVPPVLQFFGDSVHVLALIKPQFELPKESIGTKGVVRDPSLHNQVIDDISLFFKKLGLTIEGVLVSPILGPKGNKEFLLYAKK